MFAVIEVADSQEERNLTTAADAHVTWVFRDRSPSPASSLLEVLKSLALPQGDIHAWIACEIDVARRLRSYLIEEKGLSRSQIKAAGYWRKGEAGAHSKIED